MDGIQVLEAWSTFALAVLAVAAGLLGWRQLGESRTLRKSMSRAYVVVDVEGDKATRTLNLVLANVGATHAEAVSVTFDPPLEAAHDRIDHAATSAVWTQPLMPPGKRIRTVLDHAPERLKAGLPMRYDVAVTYDSPATGEQGITQTYTIDLDACAYAVRQWDPVDQQTPRQTTALETIARSAQKLAGGHRLPPGPDDG